VLNRRRFLPGFLLRVHIGEERILFPFIDAGSESVRYQNLIFRRRGVQNIQDISICSVFPFRFFIRCRKVSRSFLLTVFPEPKRCELHRLLEGQKISRGEVSSDRTGFEPEVLSIRDYIYGDPLRYISWKATAKTGMLKTKELSSGAYQPVIIDFDRINIRNREERISCITYTVLQLYRKRIPFGLKMGDSLIEPDNTNQHKLKVLKEMALYETEDWFKGQG
jgi:uncharacterized protein (DUF58 family)